MRCQIFRRTPARSYFTGIGMAEAFMKCRRWGAKPGCDGRRAEPQVFSRRLQGGLLDRDISVAVTVPGNGTAGWSPRQEASRCARAGSATARTPLFGLPTAKHILHRRITIPTRHSRASGLDWWIIPATGNGAVKGRGIRKAFLRAGGHCRLRIFSGRQGDDLGIPEPA